MKWTVTFEVDIPGSRLKVLTANELECSVSRNVRTPRGYSDVHFISAVPLGTTPMRGSGSTEETLDPEQLRAHHARVQQALKHLLWEAQNSPEWQANVQQWMANAEEDRKAGRRYRGVT